MLIQNTYDLWSFLKKVGGLDTNFRATQPYADMMTDLLIMFEKAGAKQTNNNLDISFKFDENQPELKFALSHFRDYLKTWKSITSPYLINQWDSQKLWEMGNPSHIIIGWNLLPKQRFSTAHLRVHA